MPDEAKIIGDHPPRRRLELKLLQREAAEQVGVDKASIYNWEGNRSKPVLGFIPAIIRFLGYNPVPAEGEGWGARLVQHRTALGISQKEAAARIGVDQSTLARWERGEREPAGRFERAALDFLRILHLLDPSSPRPQYFLIRCAEPWEAPDSQCRRCLQT